MKSTNSLFATLAAAAIFAAFQSPAIAQETPEVPHKANWQFNGSLMIQVGEDQPVLSVPIKAEFRTKASCKAFPGNFAREATYSTGASTGTESMILHDFFRDNAKTVLYGACTSK